jgi:uncharacterized protein YjiS (DUF1127 family)
VASEDDAQDDEEPLAQRELLMRSILAFWMRLHHRGAALGRRRAAAVKLVELDERTLRDIGLEPWSSPLGAEVALRRHELRRWRAPHLARY